MEKVITKNGIYSRTILYEKNYPYFMLGETTHEDAFSSKYRWVSLSDINKMKGFFDSKYILNFISEKYDEKNKLIFVKGYAWQDVFNCKKWLPFSNDVYIHATSFSLSHTSDIVDVYFLVTSEIEYEEWLRSKNLTVLDYKSSKFSHYLHSIRLNKVTGKIILNKRYYRKEKFDSFSESYTTVHGNVVSRK